MFRFLSSDTDKLASLKGASEPSGKPAGFQTGDDLRIERHEAKYIVPYSLMPELREYIRPHVIRDKHGIGEVPKYLVRTIQLDGRDLCLHYAKEIEALNRFKLRIRTYGTDGKAPYFVEIKRKLGSVIVKSRSVLKSDQYSPDLFLNPRAYIPFSSEKEHMNYLDFLRLTREIGAQPITMIQYERESYMGIREDYARVTFDTRIAYQMTPSYDFGYVNSGRWHRIDTPTGLRTDIGGFVLELKSKMGIPRWMLDFVRAFDLVRVGFCKYSAALRLESLNAGYEYSEGSENCVPDSKW
ncbi:MAG: polyphosphate polymerase domain-containing protein [Verrucomicrobiales bacterium]|nr:polyphosphate polymerase domain-containing protein [Verrucomicrobiales bacterium]